MFDEFQLYVRLGFHHIADLAGYDHILFIAALAIPYAPRDWRRLGILITAFTLGHSITLALATLQLVSVKSAVVEALIPVTIVVTAVLAWREASLPERTTSLPAGGREGFAATRYLLAAGFGLIHGLGFSTYLRAMLGQEERITLPLFAFNVGLEVGQLVILSVVLAVGALVVRIGLARRHWVHLLAGVTGALALALFVGRL